MRQWDAGKKQGGTLQGGFLDFFRSWDPLTHFELFAFCFMLKPWDCHPPPSIFFCMLEKSLELNRGILVLFRRDMELKWKARRLNC